MKMNALGLPSINNIKGFLEVAEGMSWRAKLAGKGSWAQEGDFIATADQKLELNGELLDYAIKQGITWTPVAAGVKTNSIDFLKSQSESGLFQAWSETTQSGNRYTVLVDYRDYSEKVLTNEQIKAEVMQFYHTEMARSMFTGDRSEDPVNLTMKIGEKIMYRFGIPSSKMGFYFDHIKSVTSIAPAKEKKWWQIWK
jgi:hypothetical protein